MNNLSMSSSLPLAHRAGRHLHILALGALVRRAGNRLVVDRGDANSAPVSVLTGDCDAIFVYGGAHLTRPALQLCLSQDVAICFFTKLGSYQGRLAPRNDRGVGLRRRQMAIAAGDPDTRLAAARRIVRAKLAAARIMIEAWGKRHPALRAEGWAPVETAAARAAEAISMESLRGIEGAAMRVYFGLLRRCLSAHVPPFPVRDRLHADPVNALLNLGYTLLLREWEGLCAGAGLDPAFGFYHEFDSTRPSLACDLMEEFRHSLVDRLVVGVLNRRLIEWPGDFEPPAASINNSMRLTGAALPRFLAAYERLAFRLRPLMWQSLADWRSWIAATENLGPCV